MAKTEKKPETQAAEAVKAVKESKTPETVVETKAAEAVKEAAPKAAKKPKAKKPAAPKTAKKAAEKKPAAPKAAKAAKAPAVKVFVEYQGRQVSQEDVVAAVKADWKGAAIKTLEVYVKPEDAAAYYVVNGKETGKVSF